MTGIIFSKNRPLQLDAALRSWHRHGRDLESVRVKVLYRASTSRLLSYYRRLARDYPDIDFIRETDFRRDLLVLLSGSGYFLFMVDDTVFVRDFSLADVCGALDKNPDSIGFSLRLGRNTTYCYMLNRPQKAPDFQELPGGYLKFRWPDAECDFGYPLELSSSVYRASELLPVINGLAFTNPNTLEDTLSHCGDRFRETHPFLLCAAQSLAFSIPLNKVQQVCDNRAASRQDYSVERLAEVFASGQRIDVAALDHFTPQSCHQELELKLTALAPSIPLVSLIVPCFRQAEYLPEAVGSVVRQTFADWEMIIVNDGSPDETSRVACDLIKEFPHCRIRLLEKRNGGLSHARNVAITGAEGAYILPLDADDLITPDFLARTVALLDAEPGVAIAYSDVEHFGSARQTIQAAEFDFQKICLNNQLNYCSLYRYEVWEQVGGYNSNMVWGYEDWNFWVGAGEKGFVARRIPGAMLRYRVKSASMFTEALAHDQENRARIVLNHPALYDSKRVSEATAIWSNPALRTPPGIPKVSVIIPTFNRPDRLEEALRSIAGQSFQDFEILVVNDNGIDIEHIVRRFRSRAEVVYLRHNSYPGIPNVRNCGLRFARGKFISYLDDDDIFLPDHLETLVTFLEASGHKAAYTDAWCAQEDVIDGGRKITGRAVRYSDDWNDDRILVQNFVPTLCFMFDRVAAIAAGGFDEQLSTHEDWDFWIRLSRLAPPAHVKKTTCEFRVRSDGTSTTSARRADFLRTLRMIYKKHRLPAAGKEDLERQRREFVRGLEKEVESGKRPFGAGMTATLRQIFGRRKQ